MFTLMYDVIDVVSRDIIEVCATLADAEREAEAYMSKHKRQAHIRATKRLRFGAEWNELMHLVREARQQREEQYERHLWEIERRQRAA